MNLIDKSKLILYFDSAKICVFYTTICPHNILYFLVIQSTHVSILL